MKKCNLIIISFFFLISLCHANETVSVLYVNQTAYDISALLDKVDFSIHEVQEKEVFDLVYFNESEIITEKEVKEYYLSYAKNNALHFILVNTYDISESNIMISSELIQGNTGNVLLSLQSAGSIDLGIERKLSYIVNKASEKISDVLSLYGSENFRYEETLPPQPEPEIVPIQSEDPAVISNQSEIEESTNRISLILTAGGSPFIPLGASRNNIKTGGSGNIGALIGIETNWSLIQLGLGIGVDMFNAEGDVRNAFLVAGRIEAQAGLLFLHDKVINLFINFGGGAALLSFKDEDAQWNTKLIPYISFSGGINFQINNLWGISTGVAMPILLEQSINIIAFKPFIETRFRF